MCMLCSHNYVNESIWNVKPENNHLGVQMRSTAKLACPLQVLVKISTPLIWSVSWFNHRVLNAEIALVGIIPVKTYYKKSIAIVPLNK